MPLDDAPPASQKIKAAANYHMGTREVKEVFRSEKDFGIAPNARVLWEIVP